MAKEKGVIVETLAVREIPRSGPGDVLLDQYGIEIGRASCRERV